MPSPLNKDADLLLGQSFVNTNKNSEFIMILNKIKHWRWHIDEN